MLCITNMRFICISESGMIVLLNNPADTSAISAELPERALQQALSSFIYFYFFYFFYSFSSRTFGSISSCLR